MNDDKDEIPNLVGKVIWLEISGSSDPAGILLEYPEFKRTAGRLFVGGRMAKFIDGWLAGVEAYVAWDAVVHFLIFNSADDYRQRATTYKTKVTGRSFFGRR